MKTSTNIFNALKTKPKKKTKEENSEKDDAPNAEKQAALEAAIFQTAPVATLGTWADEDEDLPVVGFSPPTGGGWNMAKKNFSNSRGQRYLASPQQEESQPDAESESDNESVHLDIEAELGIEVARSEDDDDDDSEDGQNSSDDDNENQDGDNSEETSSDSIDPQRQSVDTPPTKPVVQLSKKEQKKKELEDLDAVLAELGLDAPPTGFTNGDAAASTVSEGGTDSSKAAKRRQKKKQQEVSVASATTANGNCELNSASPPASSDDSNTENQDATQEMSAEAIKARKSALAKKMSGSKNKPASASAAAAAAAAAKAKKAAGKDKSRYNEMPTR